jgi:1-acyl-sn-glycerol-3-phosphate acyltransferase
MILAILIYLFVGGYILVMAPIGLTWGRISGDGHLLYLFAHFCIRVAGWMCRIKVRVKGREKLVPGQNYLFVSNHQGNFDGPVLLYGLRRDVRIVAKKEMLRIPVFSRVMKQVKCVTVDRSDPHSARASVDEAAKLLAEGYPFVTFPEGTRSRDGRLGPFKKGAFVMAIKAQVPIAPITLVDTRNLQMPGEFAIHPGTVHLIVHDPIPTTGMTLEDRDRLAEMAHAAIASALAGESVKSVAALSPGARASCP